MRVIPDSVQESHMFVAMETTSVAAVFSQLQVKIYF